MFGVNNVPLCFATTMEGLHLDLVIKLLASSWQAYYQLLTFCYHFSKLLHATCISMSCKVENMNSYSCRLGLLSVHLFSLKHRVLNCFQTIGLFLDMTGECQRPLNIYCQRNFISQGLFFAIFCLDKIKPNRNFNKRRRNAIKFAYIKKLHRWTSGFLNYGSILLLLLLLAQYSSSKYLNVSSKSSSGDGGVKNMGNSPSSHDPAI